jgi:hypothetical protein
MRIDPARPRLGTDGDLAMPACKRSEQVARFGSGERQLYFDWYEPAGESPANGVNEMPDVDGGGDSEWCRYASAAEALSGSQAPRDWVFPCGNGFLYSIQSSTLGAATYPDGATIEKLSRIPGVKVVQDDECGGHVIFPPAALRLVERIMKPRHVRKLRPSKSVASIEDKPCNGGAS